MYLYNACGLLERAKLSGVVRVALLIFGCSFICSDAATAQQTGNDVRNAVPCEKGHILTPHSPPGFDFATTSWVRSIQNASVYSTCIENHDAKIELYVDWKIPGPSSYIAPEDSVVSPRPFASRKTQDITSCLVYGNLRHTMQVHYMGHESDRARVANEDCGGLKPAISPAAPSEPPIEKLNFENAPWFRAPGRFAVPTDSEDVKHTLVRFVYEIGLIPEGKTYLLLFAFEAAPVSSDFRGKIEQLTVRPSSIEVRRAMMRQGEEDGIWRLRDFVEKRAIEFKLAESFILQDQTFQFYDVHDILVGEVHAPFLTPTAER